MNTWAWIDEIIRAVEGRKAVRLTELAAALSQAEEAKQFLCAKKYGSPTMTIDAIARLVPDAP